ncbi:MAG: hypothetical protein RLZZ271_296 [Pseudomonadota bacterium]
MVKQKNRFYSAIAPSALPLALVFAGLCLPALGQGVSPSQQATAQEVAAKGLPLSALAPNAPDRYTVKQGDTLWSIASLFVSSPWRWPELWGMNKAEISNPHKIYPGQVLVLDKSKGAATLKLESQQQEAGVDLASIPLVKVSPQTRFSAVSQASVPALQPSRIESYLVRPLIVDPLAMERAPRVVAGPDGRVLMTKGDRVYALSVFADDDRPAQLVTTKGKTQTYRIFRNAEPLKDPATSEVLAYEAKYLGSANLVRPEGVAEGSAGSGREPATLEIVDAREEIRAGDKLLPEPPHSLTSFVPHSPDKPVSARILSIHGAGVRFAGQNQVVTINQGSAQGIEPGHVLAIQTNVHALRDKTDPDRPSLSLPAERNGLLMVFRVFERVSYALVLDIVDGVQVGDRLTNPR